MSDICIYHGNCADGFGAAWAVRKALGEIDFVPGVYGNTPPDVTDRDVFMVDFSYPRQVLIEMARQAKSIVVLDHHQTAATQLVGLPSNVHTVFDMERSGAMLAWDYFHPGVAPPTLLLHIQDRDLWRFALPHTREIQANVFSFPYDFAVWDSLMAEDVSRLVSDGMAIERKHHKDIAELVRVMAREIDIGGHRVPAASLPYTMVSDAAGMMAVGRPFAACYWDTPDGRVFGLRSSSDGLDVALIAQQYGGGGHKHAAGFRVPRDSPLARA